MGFILEADCHKCSYRSGRLWVGDHEHFLAICLWCNRVVNPVYIPFRFICPDCPHCRNQLHWLGYIIDQALLLSRTDEAVPAPYRCPSCSQGWLGFREVAHFRAPFQEHYPEVGEVVHGYLTNEGALLMPNLRLFVGQPRLTKSAFADQAYRVMVLKVTAVIKEANIAAADLPVVEQLQLEFVRYLRSDEVEAEGPRLRRNYRQLQPQSIQALDRLDQHLTSLTQAMADPSLPEQARQWIASMQIMSAVARRSWPNLGTLDWQGAHASYSEVLRVLHLEGGTPLTAINGYASLLLAEQICPLSEQQRQIVSKIFHDSRQIWQSWSQVFDLDE